MIGSHVLRGRAAAIGAVVISAGLIAGVVAEAYGYMSWGGTPVSVHFGNNEYEKTVNKGDQTFIYVEIEAGTWTQGEIELSYTVIEGSTLWPSALKDPPTRIYSTSATECWFVLQTSATSADCTVRISATIGNRTSSTTARLTIE